MNTTIEELYNHYLETGDTNNPRFLWVEKIIKDDEEYIKQIKKEHQEQMEE